MTVIALIDGVTLSPINDYQFIGRTVIAGGTLGNGQMASLDATTGRAIEGIQTQMPYGIALNYAPTGEPVYLLQEGVVYGFDVSALDFGALVYTGVDGALEDTMTQEGEPLVDAAVVVGRVVPTSELGVKAVEFRL